MEEKIIEYVMNLFTLYGWWFIALVGATFGIMLLVNWGIKKAFSKATSEQAQRIRKVVSSLCVYIVAGIVIVIANLIAKHSFDFNFVLVNCIPVGALAMVVWAIVKVVRDLGFSKLIELIAKSKTIKNLLAKLPIDKEVANTIYDKLIDAIDESKGDNAEIVATKETELLSMASSMLSGFVDAEQISTTAQGIVDALKIKFNVVKKEN